MKVDASVTSGGTGQTMKFHMRWWSLLIRGLVALAFGIITLFWPQITVGLLVAFFGAFALVGGIFALVGAFGDVTSGQRIFLIIDGILGIVVGGIAFFWPFTAALALYFLIAAWALAGGIIMLITAGQVHKQGGSEWLMIVNGICGILFGLILLFVPEAGLLALKWIVGFYGVIFGIIFIVMALEFRGRGQREIDIDLGQDQPAT